MQKFDLVGNYISQFGTKGIGNGQFIGPVGVAVDLSNSDVYVVDSSNDRVQKFGLTGSYISQFGAAGTGNGQFQTPVGVAVELSTSDVYVTDEGNNRVRSSARPATTSLSSEPAVTATANSPPRSGSWSTPPPATYTSPNRATTGCRSLTSPATTSRSSERLVPAPAEFNVPAEVAVDPSDSDVYVTDSINDRVEKFGVGAVTSACGSLGFATGAGTAVAVQLSCSVAGGALAPTYQIVSGPGHGSLSGLDQYSGAVTYTPAAGFFGTDSFTYQGAD